MPVRWRGELGAPGPGDDGLLCIVAGEANLTGIALRAALAAPLLADTDDGLTDELDLQW